MSTATATCGSPKCSAAACIDGQRRRAPSRRSCRSVEASAVSRLHADGGVVVSGRDITHVQPDGTNRLLFAPPEGVTGFNDIGATVDGTILAGGLRFMPFANDEVVPGAFWHITAPEPAELVLDDVAWPNGVGDDGSTWRFCDYHRGTVTVMDHGGGTERRVLTTPSGEADGLAFDDDGGMWVAQPRMPLAACDSRRTATSIAPIDIAGHQPASLAFGGDAMYVTTIAATGTSGALLRVDAGVTGPRHPHRHDLENRRDACQTKSCCSTSRRSRHLTLNRPEARNALSREVLRTLPRIVQECDARDDVRVVILTGADPAFCAGLDLKELGERGPPRRAGMAEPPTDPRGPLPRIGKPIIGAINGAAITGGFELALNCDFLVASDRARFADTHTRVGIQPGWGLTVLLREAVGVRRARELSTTGNFLDAQTALTWGLVNHVVPHEQLLPFCRQLAADIASNDPAGVRRILATYADGSMTTDKEAWTIEARVAREWMAGGHGSAAEVAQRRESVIARGRGQVR